MEVGERVGKTMLTWCMTHYRTAAIALFVIYLIQIISTNIAILTEQIIRARLVKALLRDSRVDLKDAIDELRR